MNITSIMAHQDDEMYCLGTMLRCKARGDSLHFITLADGSKGFVQSPEIPREKAAAIRHKEMSDVAAAMGATFTNLREFDEFLYDTQDLRMRLIEAIRATRADVVFTHYGVDYNMDHMTTNLLVRHCCMQSCLPMLPTQSPPLKAHPAVFLIEPHGPIDFSPTHYVDISAVAEEKSRILALHASQEEAFNKLGKSMGKFVQIASRFRGDKVDCAHAEAFVSMQARGAIKPFAVLP